MQSSNPTSMIPVIIISTIVFIGTRFYSYREEGTNRLNLIGSISLALVFLGFTFSVYDIIKKQQLGNELLADIKEIQTYLKKEQDRIEPSDFQIVLSIKSRREEEQESPILLTNFRISGTMGNWPVVFNLLQSDPVQQDRDNHSINTYCSILTEFHQYDGMNYFDDLKGRKLRLRINRKKIGLVNSSRGSVKLLVKGRSMTEDFLRTLTSNQQITELEFELDKLFY